MIAKHHVEALIDGVLQAGRQILSIYQRDFDVSIKKDDSPLTEADMAAHHALVNLLNSHFPAIPVLSEEDENVSFEQRRSWERYFLIDPLDGTKEFISKNGEFTLNVALIDQGEPVFGIVHAPVLGITWWGARGIGAFKRDHAGKVSMIHVRSLPEPGALWQIVASRRHGGDLLERFCSGLPPHQRVSMGSSIKLCLVAEGKADLYPRFAPTCEWDTGAAHAVVWAAGGEVLNAETGQPLRYNQKSSLLNPWFIVYSRKSPCWQRALQVLDVK